MTTAELIRNNNVYRAIGGECWYATFEAVSTTKGVRSIKPVTRKVRVVKPVCGSLDSVCVTPISGDGRLLSALPEELFDDRDHAKLAATQLCESLDGQSVRGFFTYQYLRPKVRKPKAPPIEVRVRQIGSTAYVVDRRVDGRWKEVRGLGYLTKWKATDTAKRIRCGLDVPGYWMMPGGEEFIELCDYEV